MDYQYTLDPSSKKFHCPQCNKRRFVRYWDNKNKAYLAEHLGRCDREVSCAYHSSPKNDFKASFKPFKASDSEQNNKAFTINYSLFERSLQKYSNNNFFLYLEQLFSKQEALELTKRYNVGTSKHWEGATIFWQKDLQQRVRTGKVMLYNKQTGKRIKKPYNHINWIHSLLQKKQALQNYKLKQCLFGEHLLKEYPKDKLVAIVESEKTAILMSLFYPDYLWLACGSLSNINKGLLTPLQTYKVILYPDLGAFDRWQAKSKELSKVKFKITISTLLESKATAQDRAKGLDIADFFLKTDCKTGFALTEDNYPLFWDL